MRMIIGGSFQGKLSYAEAHTGLSEKEFADGSSCGSEALFRAKGIRNFQEYIKRQLLDGQPVDELAEQLIEKNPDIVVVTDEVGYGVVPVNPFERRYREACGRICCKLAAFSEEVVRVVCGIGTVIKG